MREGWQYCCNLGDDALVIGHRLSEWTSHAPLLEEELALANIALDHLGQAQFLFEYAATREELGRSADELVFFRSASEYRNFVILELSLKSDFAATIVRQFLYEEYLLLFLESLAKCKDQELSAFAQKAVKETSYHTRHLANWILRLGDGTEESHQKVTNSLTLLTPYTEEFFRDDEIDEQWRRQNLLPLRSALKTSWEEKVAQILTKASLDLPRSKSNLPFDGRSGKHTAELESMLLEMQEVARCAPGARW